MCVKKHYLQDKYSTYESISTCSNKEIATIVFPSTFLDMKL